MSTYRKATLYGSYARLAAHLVVAVGAVFGVMELKPSDDCYDSCGISVFLQILVTIYAVVELLGLPLDIFNIYMADTNKNLVYDKSSMIINGGYMIANFIIIAITGYYTIFG